MISSEDVLNWAEVQQLKVTRLRNVAGTCAIGHSIKIDMFGQGLRLLVKDIGGIYLGFDYLSPYRELLPKFYLPHSIEAFNKVLSKLGEFNRMQEVFLFHEINSITELIEGVHLFMDTLCNKNVKSIKFLDLRNGKVNSLNQDSFIRKQYDLHVGRGFNDYNKASIKSWLCPEDSKRLKSFAVKLKKFVRDYLYLEKSLEKELGNEYHVYYYKSFYEHKILVSREKVCAQINIRVNHPSLTLLVPNKNKKLKCICLGAKDIHKNLTLDIMPVVKIIKEYLEGGQSKSCLSGASLF